MSGNDKLTSKGYRIHWLWRNEEAGIYQHESVFLSHSLYDKCDRYSYPTRERGLQIGESDISLPKVSATSIRRMVSNSSQDAVEFLPQNLVKALQMEDVPTQKWDEVLMSDDLQQEVCSGQVQTLYTTVVSASAAVAEYREHTQREESLRGQQANLSDDHRDNKYSGPLFAYEVDKDLEDIEADDEIERKSPINVAWHTDVDKDEQEVMQTMKTNGWTAFSTTFPHLSETRYVIINDWQIHLEEEATHGSKQAGLPSVLSPDQWHCRTFKIPNRMDQYYEVAGQAHRDRWDHEQFDFGNPNPRFARSREEVKNDWVSWRYNHITNSIGNGNQFPSSKGKLSRISQ